MLFGLFHAHTYSVGVLFCFGILTTSRNLAMKLIRSKFLGELSVNSRFNRSVVVFRTGRHLTQLWIRTLEHSLMRTWRMSTDGEIPLVAEIKDGFPAQLNHFNGGCDCGRMLVGKQRSRDRKAISNLHLICMLLLISCRAQRRTLFIISLR